MAQGPGGEKTEKPTPKRIKDARYVAVKDAPHCLIWTHPEVVNTELVSFLE